MNITLESIKWPCLTGSASGETVSDPQKIFFGRGGGAKLRQVFEPLRFSPGRPHPWTGGEMHFIPQ